MKMPDAIWRFKLDAIDRVNMEILRWDYVRLSQSIYGERRGSPLVE